MQEEINEKTISVSIKGAKVTGNVLKSALKGVLHQMEKKHAKSEQEKAAEKQAAKEAVPRGKQSLKSMMDSGSELTNIEITDSNIKSFEKVARKYSIDYSLKKDRTADPPRYLVFFRARDVSVMTAAFKEYTGETMSKEEKRPSVRNKLSHSQSLSIDAKQREREKTRKKEKEETR